MADPGTITLLLTAASVATGAVSTVQAGKQASAARDDAKRKAAAEKRRIEQSGKAAAAASRRRSGKLGATNQLRSTNLTLGTGVRP